MFTHEPEECYCGTCGALLETDGPNPGCFECRLWLSAPVPQQSMGQGSTSSIGLVDSPENSGNSKGTLEVEYGDRLDVTLPLERGARRLG